MITMSQRPLLKAIVVIPCLNEKAFIADVVRSAQKTVDEVVVIDDGSKDNTAEASRAAGAQVIRHGRTQGYGGAIRSAFEVARERGSQVLAILDGDAQHNPEELPEIISPIVNGQADLVIGSRFLGRKGNMPRYRRFGIAVITWLTNLGARVKVSDAQSGFRAYSREVIDSVVPRERGMGVSAQILIQARSQGFRIAEVPITCHYHPASSTLSPVRHGLGVVLVVVKCRLACLWRKPVSRFSQPRSN